MKTVRSAILGMMLMGVGQVTVAAEVVNTNCFTMFNIIQCRAGEEVREAQDALNFVERTGCPYVLYSLTLHPQGRPAMRTVDEAIAAYHKWAAQLAGTKAKPGILLQAILGHWTRVDGDEEHWQREIDQRGKVQRFCPLDPSFRAYIREVGVKLAKEHPSVIMSDDDVTSFHDHAAQCFCPLHRVEFNRRTGLKLDDEGFRKLIITAKPGDPLLEAFVKLQGDTITSVVKLLREGIDSVDPSIPGGSCMPYVSWERERVAEYARILAGRHVPFLRTCNGQYGETAPMVDYPNLMAKTMAYQDRLRDFPCLLDEADTFPHNLWAKSSRTMHAKLAGSAFVGLRGAKLWFVGGHKDNLQVSPSYLDILAKHTGYYDAIVKIVNGSTLNGVAIPCHRNFLEANPATSVPGLATYDDDSWAERRFGVFGIPFRMSLQLGECGAIFALAGAKAVQRFSDAELKELLSQKVLVDGSAARELIRRGYGPLIGVEAGKGARPKHKAEWMDALNTTLPLPMVTEPLYFAALPGAKVLASFIWVDSSGANEGQSAAEGMKKVAPSATVYRNALGGTIAVTAYYTDITSYYAESEVRKQYVLKLLEALEPTLMENVCANDQDIFTLARQSKVNANEDFVFTVNLNYDSTHELSFYRSAKPISVKRMDAHGVFNPIEFTWKDGILTLPITLNCYEETILSVVADK